MFNRCLKLMGFAIGIFFGALLLPATVFAADASFQAGKDYEIIMNNMAINTLPAEKVQVLEFFSYGCPGCRLLDPTLSKWLVQENRRIDFSRVPVIFHPEWRILAKAYYAAKALNVLETIHPALFTAIHEQGRALANERDVEQWFIEQGVKKDDFENAFEFSPGIEAQINRGNNLMNAYKVYAIPAIVVQGKYKTSLGMAGGTQRLIQIVDFLIAKAQSDLKG